jgi:hypothetical protein
MSLLRIAGNGQEANLVSADGENSLRKTQNMLFAGWGGLADSG